MRLLASTFIVIILSACSGVKFADERVNKNLPLDFKNRNIYPKTDIFKYELDSLVGRILVCKPDQIDNNEYKCDLKLQRILKKDPDTGQTLFPETKTPDQLVYSSKIDRDASAQGSYLAFAASFSADQVSEILITDSALVFTKDSDIPVNDLLNYVKANPKNQDEQRFWVQGALLATIVQRDLTKIETNAEGVVGNTTGVKGQVFNSTGEESIDYRISLLIPNIDQDLDPISASFNGLDKARGGVIIRSISGLESLPIKD